MLRFSEALSRLLDAAAPLGAERASLDEAAGRVLAEDVIAPGPLPPFDYSAMDGYTLRAADLEGPGPWDLPVIGESAAGGALPSLVPGAACRIFTGARLPDGADTVIMQENVERTGDRIRFTGPAQPGVHIRRRGEDLAAGAIALARGARLDPGKIALAASLDRPQLYVARRPVVTVLCSGDELRSPGQEPRPGSVVESNGYFVAAAARAAGAIVRVAPFVPDDEARSKIAVRDALRGTDLLVTIGGVSVGDRDVVKPALEAAGVTLDFWKVKIKPGKPLAVGHLGPTHVLGLPGNPASASLTFLLFGMPLLRALQGDTAPTPTRFRAAAASGMRRHPGREEFARARLQITNEGLRVSFFRNQASGSVVSFAEADAVVVIPEEREEVREGELLDVMRLVDF
ncbi:MAG: gephyrin-like molybdotransferase Glp [Byssovorax sp.]